jgi:hypothetical protein
MNLSFLQHDFGGLDDGGDGVANLEVHFFDAAAGDDAFDHVGAHLDYYVGHDVSNLKFSDFADQVVAGGYSHAQNCNELPRMCRVKLYVSAGIALSQCPTRKTGARSVKDA